MARNVCAASWVGAAVPVFRRPRVSRRGGVGRLAQPSAAMAGPLGGERVGALSRCASTWSCARAAADFDPPASAHRRDRGFLLAV